MEKCRYVLGTSASIEIWQMSWRAGDHRVLSHYMTVASRNIKHAELKKFESGFAVRKEAFQAICDLSSEYIDDDEHLNYYTQSLICGFLFTADDRDALVTSNKTLAPTIKLMKKEDEAAHEVLQKRLKKTKNLQELDEIFKKLEGRVR